MNEKQKHNLLLGYCCINMHLRDHGIFCSRTCRLDTIKQRGIQYSYDLANQNLQDLATIFKWNHQNGIHLYRMSSEMFPFATHPDYYQEYDLNQFSDVLQRLGQLAKRYNQRVTFHPGQYNQLSSLREVVVEKAIIDIDFHARVMDMMNIDNGGVIVIHGGSKQDGKINALKRFKASFSRLSLSSQQRLVLENCEMVYAVEDLIDICEELQIPVVIDYHHHNINPGTRSLTELTEQVLSIWKQRGIIPLFHVSESRTGVKETDNITARRAHSDYVQVLPQPLLDVINENVIHVDIEAKMKEQAVLYLYSVYGINKVNEKNCWKIIL